MFPYAYNTTRLNMLFDGNGSPPRSYQTPCNFLRASRSSEPKSFKLCKLNIIIRLVQRRQFLGTIVTCQVEIST